MVPVAFDVSLGEHQWWVLGSLEQVLAACAGTFADVQRMKSMDRVLHSGHSDVDFVLPRDAARLQEALNANAG